MFNGESVHLDTSNIFQHHPLLQGMLYDQVIYNKIKTEVKCTTSAS